MSKSSNWESTIKPIVVLSVISLIASLLLALVMVLVFVPTVALAEDASLAGFCGGDANTEKFETITGKTWVYGNLTTFSTDIYKNVSWRLDENGTDTYTLTLSGSGKMADYLAGSVRPWNSYASKITKLIVEDGVSSVGSRTCYNFKVLTDISLADTVTDIGEFSFSGCSALVSVDLSNVTSIRANALRDDPALSDIQLSHDLKVIDYQAFRDSGADNSSISIPASVTEIGFGAFDGAKFTNVLNLPNVKKVGAFAFSNSKFAAVVLTNAELEIVSGKVDTSGNEYDDSVFSGNEAVFYTSVPSVMDKLYCDDRKNNIGIIACTNGGSFASDAGFHGFTLAVPQKDGCVFAGWFSDPDLTKTEGLSEENGTYTGTPTTDIHADGRRYYAKWEPSADSILGKTDGEQMAVDFGTVFYGDTPSATVTFTGSNALKEIKSYGGFFEAKIDGMNVVITPKADLQPGTYTDTLYVHTENGAVHFISVTLTVTEKSADSDLPFWLPAAIGSNPFSDVAGGAYYNEAVRWAVKNGVASGTDAKHFSPDAACTRGQAVTFLWRAAGCPAPALAENPFADVKPTDYCYDAVLWAVQTGVAKGTSASTFSPDAACTRGQIVTFLYRAAGSPSGYANSGYTDVPETSYCAAPVAWAVALRVTSGTSAITFSPDALCTRAQIVTFLYRANA